MVETVRRQIVAQAIDKAIVFCVHKRNVCHLLRLTP
jgi:hypothetical protein